MAVTHVSKELEIDIKRRGANGVLQAAVSRIEEKFGFPKLCKLHSPRNWFATCAGQLLYAREHREKLGRRAPGSVIPDHYGRAVCATELRMRAGIIAKVNSGWRQSAAFEVPSTTPEEGLTRKTDVDLGSLSSDVESTSETDSVMKTDPDVEDIAKLDN